MVVKFKKQMRKYQNLNMSGVTKHPTRLQQVY